MNFSFGCTYPSIDQHLLVGVGREVDEKEIKQALFSKPRLNPFFQSQWKSVGASVIAMVKSVFLDPSVVRQVNATQIVCSYS